MLQGVVRPHIHGVEDKIGGRFWVTSSDSKEVDLLACSMNKLSIKSPSSQRSGQSISLPETGRDDQSEGDGSTVVVQANGATLKEAFKEVICPWEGPLLASRTSPKLSFGDVLVKAKVRMSSTLTDDFSLSSELRRSLET
jgi:hypothetical protein